MSLQEIAVSVGVALAVVAATAVAALMIAVVLRLGRPRLPRSVKRLVCRLLGHDWWSVSVPAVVPSFPDIQRVRRRSCARCGDKEWSVNEL